MGVIILVHTQLYIANVQITVKNDLTRCLQAIERDGLVSYLALAPQPVTFLQLPLQLCLQHILKNNS